MDRKNVFSRRKEDLNRITKIASVLYRFEFYDYSKKIKTEEKLPPKLPELKEPNLERKTKPQRLRLAIEELGTTFVKFGQIMSTRGDIIGTDYASELSKLQDNMNPFPAEQAKRIVEEQLGKPVSEIFKSFEDTPLASASIAQVHRATLKDGTRVVVKIQRPGIEKNIVEDIRIMHYLAQMAEKHIPEAHNYDPVYLVNEFERSIMKELDFLRESRSAMRLKDNFKGTPGIYIPVVYEELCASKVLTMEEVMGTKLADVIKSNSKKFNKKLIMHRFAEAFFKMVLIDGFYHADPHPGNIMILKNNVICFLDYGRVGMIDKDVAENIFRFALFAVDNDANGLIAHLVRTGMLNDTPNTESLKADISDMLDKYYSTKIKDIKIGAMLTDLVSLLGKYEFNRPRELAELTRTLVILEGVGTGLDPKFSVAEEFEPYAKRVLPPSFSIQRIATTLGNNLIDIEYLARTFPVTIRRFMNKIEEGKIKIEMEHKDLNFFTVSLDRISNKLSMSLLLSSLIIGSSLIVQANRTLGLVGFVVSALIGIMLILKMLL